MANDKHTLAFQQHCDRKNIYIVTLTAYKECVCGHINLMLQYCIAEFLHKYDYCRNCSCMKE